MKSRILVQLSVLASTTTMMRAFSSSRTAIVNQHIPAAVLDRLKACNVDPPRPLVPFHWSASSNAPADAPPLGLCDRSIVPIICASDPSSFTYNDGEGLVLTKTSTDDANEGETIRDEFSECPYLFNSILLVLVRTYAHAHWVCI